jgi:DHA1 family tetracycline resistance protein-like MFS transporter
MPVLLMTILLSGLGFGLVLPSFLFFAENLGASSTVATTIIGTFAIGQFIATPIWGRLSDRYGRKPMLVASLVGQSFSYLLLAFADNLWLLAVARLLNGLTAGNLSVAMAYITDVTPLERRAQGMGYAGGAISLGFIIGPALGGILGGSDASAASLTQPALLALVICAVTAVAGLFLLKDSRTPEQRAEAAANRPPESGFSALIRAFKMPVLARMVAVGFFVYLAMAQFETIFPLWSGARFGWGPREVGLSFTYLGLVVGITQALLVGRLVTRFGEGRLTQAALVSYAVGLIAMTQAPTWPIMLIGVTFTAAGGALFMTAMTSLVSKEAAESDRGLVIGVYQSGSWMGRSFGPPLSGLLFEGVGANSPLLFAAAIMLPALVIVSGILARMRADAGPVSSG